MAALFCKRVNKEELHDVFSLHQTCEQRLDLASQDLNPVVIMGERIQQNFEWSISVHPEPGKLCCQFNKKTCTFWNLFSVKMYKLLSKHEKNYSCCRGQKARYNFPTSSLLSDIWSQSNWDWCECTGICTEDDEMRDQFWCRWCGRFFNFFVIHFF